MDALQISVYAVTALVFGIFHRVVVKDARTINLVRFAVLWWMAGCGIAVFSYLDGVMWASAYALPNWSCVWAEWLLLVCVSAYVVSIVLNADKWCSRATITFERRATLTDEEIEQIVLDRR